MRVEITIGARDVLNALSLSGALPVQLDSWTAVDPDTAVLEALYFKDGDVERTLPDEVVLALWYDE